MNNLENDTIILTNYSGDVATTDINMNTGTITIDVSNYGAAQSYITSDTIDVSTITLTNDIFINGIGPWGDNPFEDCFPEWHDFQEMCKEYPGLEKAYEHLKVFYKLCKDEWEAKKKEAQK